ncbi:MAG: RNase P subunit p30 family protein [Methanoregulaceae archaeon]
MADLARSLGFTGIVAIGSGQSEHRNVRIIPGTVIQENAVKGLLGTLKKLQRDAGIVFVNAGDNSFNRTVITQRKVNVLRHLYKTDRGSFDHITARMAAERGVAIDLSMRPLLFLRGTARQKVLQRYQDILVLQRHYGFPLTISSHACSVLEQRSVRDITGLCALFGMSPDEIGNAFGTMNRILEGDSPVRVVVP